MPTDEPHPSSRPRPAGWLPDRARIVIIGGGVIGTSTAYHLAQLGERDVLLLEQGTLSCGTTWHAAGLVGLLRATESGTRLVQYSADLYSRLEAQTGLATGYRRCGGLIVARTADRMTQLRRTAANAEAYDLECELLTPAQAGQRYPLLRTEDLTGAIWLPGDGVANPTDVTQSLARGARTGGVRIVERARVTGVDVRAGRVRGVRVETADGAYTVETDIVVNCAGQWAKAVGALAGVGVPLHSAEHFYVVTDRIDGVSVDTPILRDPDGWTYIKEEVGGLVVGGFEPQAKAWRSPDDLPYPFEFQLLPEDWDHFSVLMDSAVHRLPVLEHTGIKKMYNGPESFTPDNQFILGESPTVAGFFVGAGFNSVGIASAGGAGRALAEWIVEGVPTQDLVAVDVRRFGSFHANTTWLRARVTEVLGLHYAVPWPNRELETARPFRRSPVHHRLAAAGAWFGSKMGWERPNYFAPPGHAPQAEYGWGRQNWHDWVVAEQLATRRQVALFDETSFGKLRVTGPDALRLLSLVCAGQVDVEPGRVVYTPMLNSRAGYEADLTVTRVGEDDFLLLTSSASPVRDGDWLRRHSGDGWRVSVEDVSAALAVFGLMGPDSRGVLGQLTSTDLVDFPFGTSRLIEVGPFTVRGTRITYVGELGWELCVPVEFAEDVYALLLQAGVCYGLREAGYYAINALRLDKGYRAFGAELTPDRTPVEAGLVFATRPGGGFIGAEALSRARAEGPRRRLVSLVVDDPQPVLWGGELVRLDGVATGQVTSAAYSATSRSCVGLAYLWNASGEPVTREQIAPTGYTVDVGGQSVPAKVSLRAPYDPDGTRVRG